ncbi:ABC transporter substrate-binding protein [Sporosarcina ureae]|uniref:Iron-uptake system-binding protein n=2 Tax=Sporosarcina ureae TaxID=1571 RepID=A0ABM6JZG0_SPOUR|nr:ABC transporter substrate-binding protein [Sporosarcina ureae]ARF15631.1 iron-uptake system-binding protein [Sporosarcina ureae]
MKKQLSLLVFALMAILVLAACGGKVEEEKTPENDKQESTVEKEATQQSADDGAAENGMQEITYLGETYSVPENVERIVITGAMEAMEDATVLNIEPVGGITVAGEFPETFKAVVGNTESIGEKQQPNFEKILELQPDVILGTTKFKDEVVEKLEQIAPTILVSHISTNWQDNLKLMAQLGDKEEEAETLLAQYDKDIKAATEIKEEFEGKTVMAIRIRGGSLFVYPEDVFFNPSLYNELGIDVPKVVQKAKAQEEISIEQLAEVNPDVLFIQVQTSGNQENEQAYEELKKNPIIQNINAFKNDAAYSNIVDSLLEGGTVLSKIEFLKALEENVLKK